MAAKIGEMTITLIAVMYGQPGRALFHAVVHLIGDLESEPLHRFDLLIDVRLLTGLRRQRQRCEHGDDQRCHDHYAEPLRVGGHGREGIAG